MFRTLLRWTLRLGALAAVATVVARLAGNRDANPESAALARNDVWPPVPTAPNRTA